MAYDIIDAMTRGVFNFSWKMDYGKLHQFVCGDPKHIGCAKLWGSPPPSDSFWKMVEMNGFEVKTYERSKSGKEKKIDVAIAHQMTKDAYTKIDKTSSEIYLVAGDKDYVPVVLDLVENGFIVTVVFWDNVAVELKEVASNFISLNQYLDHLTY
ncbi:MAG: NYN domain-containing protein [Bacteroidia bacterium]|nr:NYN domain-containing protein [Bacteroidia bacterium]